ncbi:hypothetical protein OIO90_003536 [Microbotryomycetes sp. JL221]|nr:hypothetical protein OIO90_003536 [Microbotryomycetes sp. JL221]
MTTTTDQMTTDYYTLLGCNPSTSRDELKQAYRRLVMLWHPDKQQQQQQHTHPTLDIDGGDDLVTSDQDETARAVVARLNEAWSVLRDDVKRQRYDNQLRQTRAVHRASTVSVGLTVDLEDMTPMYDKPDDEYPTSYQHACRCGSLYLITDQQLQQTTDSNIVVQCQGCTERCCIEFQVVYD